MAAVTSIAKNQVAIDMDEKDSLCSGGGSGTVGEVGNDRDPKNLMVCGR